MGDDGGSAYVLLGNSFPEEGTNNGYQSQHCAQGVYVFVRVVQVSAMVSDSADKTHGEGETRG